ncbi:hypothetical protein [Nocardia sp. NPDC050435]|uniref:hypothetical protein n=1 Tax=Nocardia sp. NPDC050435 TaxID=3155040 RepID=UPI0033D4A906
MPNPNINPDNHGEEITGLTAEQRAREVERLNALADIGTAAEKLAAQLGEPVIPDGGNLGRTIAPHISRAAKVLDGLRVWAPALLATIAFLVVVFTAPVPGPLAVYGLGLVGFAWWMAAGRPTLPDAIRMTGYAAVDFGRFIKRVVTRLAVRRAAHETRRTTADATRRTQS